MNKKKSLKVLAIGNSFSEDGTAHLWDIATSYGLKNVIIGNLYIPGCSLETHANNALNNLNNYIYYKNTSGEWMATQNTSIIEGLLDEKWDIITVQQVSGKSGQANTFDPYLTTVIDYVQENKTNEDAIIGWHMTWAYESTSTHGDFSNYNRNQLTMYKAIVDAVKTTILDIDEIEFIIPAGTAIQNVRTSVIGDTLTRDGFHLSLNLGRYIAGLTWFKAITGASIDDIQFRPTGVTNQEVEIAKEAVNHSIFEPLKVTQSSYNK